MLLAGGTCRWCARLRPQLVRAPLLQMDAFL
jgi:hypothetical protein